MSRKNGELIQDLKECLASGEALVIVGAGVSLACTDKTEVASWTGLLKHGVSRCEEVANALPPGWGDRVRAEIGSGDLDDLLSAAEKISNKLGAPLGGEYRRWLRETVGALQARDLDLVHALKALGVPLATTNYDGILAVGTQRPAVTWMDGARIQRVLRREEEGILHFHGHWEKPESVVLGIRSYEKILGDAVNQSLLVAVASLKTMVFVGCGEGLHDPNFGSLLQWMQNFWSSESRHFRLALEADVASLQSRHPPEQRLFVLPFGNTHADLVPFLKSLPARQARPIPTSESTTANPGSTARSASALPPRRVCLGRDTEVEAVVQAILHPLSRPFSVLGGPGIGKSTVVISALHDAKVAARFAVRRYFIRCDGHASRESMVGEIARVLKVPVSESLESQVLLALGTQPCCLVLDNFETPWEADVESMEEWLALLAGVPGLVFCITSRIRQQPLGVSWQDPIEIIRLGQLEARNLFLAVAGQKHGADPNLAILLGVADGVPLALSLLGHLAEAEPNLSAVWSRWQSERTTMLRRGSGDSPQLNIATSFELSIQGPRMTDASRSALSILALLPSGIAHADIEACIPDSGGAIAVLRSTGLVFDEGGRLRLLTPVREYIKKEHGPSPQWVGPALDHFLGLALEYGDKVGTPGGAEALLKLAPETANIEAMLFLGLDGESPTRAIQAAIKFGEFVRFTSLGTEQPLIRAMDSARFQGILLLEANCIKSLGDIFLARSDHARASAHYEVAIPLYQQVGAILGEANCIQSLGDIFLRRSDHARATAQYEMALPLYRQEGSVLGEANCIKSLGDMFLVRSDHARATAQYEMALPLYRQVGDVLGEANCIQHLGDICLDRSELARATAQYEMALPLYRQVGDVLGEANCFMRLGEIFLRSSDHAKATPHYEQALPLFRQVGSVLGEANCIKSLGDIFFERSDHVRAIAQYEMALPLYRQVVDVLGEANCIQRLGDFEVQAHNPERAREKFRTALDLYKKIPEPFSIGGSYWRLARLSQSQPERLTLIAAAIQAWKSIDREDLVARILEAFDLSEAELP